ncbi:MAG: hypothetical protein ACM34O_12345 [Ignavibacteria bacterium]
MKKTKDILKQKANEAQPLSSIKKDEPVPAGENFKTETIVNEEGKKVLVFKDPLHSKENRSIVNYTIFRGKWDLELMDDIDENEPEKCAITFTPVKDNSNLTIAFKSLKDRVEFMHSIYSQDQMKQRGGGMSLEKLTNSKVVRNTGGIIGLSLAGYGLYKLLSKIRENLEEKE